MRVNIYKDQIKTSGPMPPLPNDKALYASLRPAYNVLKAAGQERRGGTPMYAISEEQKKAADTMLQVTCLTACISVSLQLISAMYRFSFLKEHLQRC